jgi:hypothetical protein
MGRSPVSGAASFTLSRLFTLQLSAGASFGLDYGCGTVTGRRWHGACPLLPIIGVGEHGGEHGVAASLRIWYLRRAIGGG